MARPVRIPDASHSIRIAPGASPIVVVVAGKVIADTARALVLSETSCPPVLYIPRRDIDMALLTLSAHTTYCPYKGEAAYYSIPLGGARSLNAAWSYEAPYAAVAAIRDHLAFYPDRVDLIVEWFGDCPSALPRHDLALGPVQHAA
jgi:uncharacterized protein (DUF427 family)